MSLLHLAILLPFIAAVFVPFLFKGFRSIHTGWFVLLVPLALFIYFIQYMPVTSSGQTVSQTFEWIPSLGINFTAYVDGLGLLFALLITGIGSLVVLYSIYYLAKEKEALHNFYVYLLMFMGAMLGVVLSDNLIVLYMFWEFTSISSFLLIGYWYDKERSRYGAQKSMLITVFGGLSMLGGIVLLYMMGGTFSIRELIGMSGELMTEPLFLFAMILILLGAFTKSAQFPFHVWLPDAMEAPTPVSAYLHSATMVKAGIYLVARMSPVFAESGVWLWLVAGFGIFTLFWGSFNAVKQTDLKGILAFSTVSQLGLIMSLLGLGAAALHFDTLDENMYMTATIAAVFHLINHATFKGSLFMMAGIVDHETGTRDIRKLGGLVNLMPITFTIAIIGSFSMAGLPPFNGFLSKEMFLTGMISVFELDLFNLNTWGILFPVLAWIASVFTFIYSIKLVFKTFLGKPQFDKLPKKPHEAPIGMLISPLVLVALVIIFGFFPNLLANSMIKPAVESILPSLTDAGQEVYVNIYFWHGFQPELFMTLGIILTGTLMYATLAKWQGIYNRIPERFTINGVYDRGIDRSESGSFKLNEFVMTGYMRSYLIYIFAFFVAILLSTLGIRDAFAVDTSNLAEIRIYEVALALVLVAGAITILFAKSRLTSIVLLGVVGYSVALFFVFFRAPDLALTQLVIETVSVALFLLCFYHLPEISRKEERMKFKFGNAVISVLVGVTVTLIAIASFSNHQAFESISQYHIDNVYDLAAGGNMVNVILVDFRGFDTLFEICVLGIAALGIYAMVNFRGARGQKR
ncbi:Na+/H+ antiporter subunit A [Jeotgalibacillus haloalkalitolerans]|uniref:Na+/H+ antiporter subunit A n=1 Tax=Jeotgalibacillus haloalkalitolerans TaxID=3104292 RepID=A0ABU5KS57_9BACL|nr:Na+/H+ antiporter subunit A [Jeotgalibacillus sp. HH7-29]MDZ5713641.1 Na+/H+ antiporter subunit A [Jeotgalibacillus sp. HH7-29]